MAGLSICIGNLHGVASHVHPLLDLLVYHRIWRIVVVTMAFCATTSDYFVCMWISQSLAYICRNLDKRSVGADQAITLIAAVGFLVRLTYQYNACRQLPKLIRNDSECNCLTI